MKLPYIAPAKRLGILATICLVISSANDVKAQTVGVFSNYAGTWSGSGTLTHSSGATERMRCQAQYTVYPGGQALKQNLRCTSDTAVFELVSEVNEYNGALNGTWTETTRGAGGALSGRIDAGNMQCRIEGPGFTANVSLTARAGRQSVVIKSEGTEYTNVVVTLSPLKR